jgi:Spy/CpxP family protein refolding chaperone
MAERLELDETQRQSIQNIIEAAKPEFEALRDRVQAEVEAVLTEEQLAELEELKERGRGKGDRRRKR